MMEYQHKEAAIKHIAETLNPLALRELATELTYIANRKEIEQAKYEDKLLKSS